MKRPSLSSRRLLSLVATAAVGVVAALAFASPASAHDVEVTGVPGSCVGNPLARQITWTLTNQYDYASAKITKVESTPAGVFQGAVGSEVAAGVGKQVKFTETVADGVTDVTIKVTVAWKPHWDDPKNPHEGEVSIDLPPCVKPPAPSPSASPSHSTAASASPSASSSAAPPAVHTSTPSLPVTGVNAVAIAGAAVVLVGAGVLLVLYTRRRQVPGTR